MIRPLDLQTMFMNLDKVGKELSQSKEAQAQAQAAQVQRLHKEHERGDQTVGQTGAVMADEGDPAVKVRSDGTGPGGGKPRDRKNPPAGDGEKDKNDSAWTDPELGTHVDISG